ncbi:anthranilate synthase component I [archaeon SCG-AAA382B04]|nr:anthranilate synthase component I [archaeon SCG-AAA382B04]
MNKKPKLKPIKQTKKIKKEINPAQIYKQKGEGFLLETREFESDRVNYSIIGLECNNKIKINQNKTKIEGKKLKKQIKNQLKTQNSIKTIKSAYKKINHEKTKETGFTGGLIGYFSFEITNQLSHKLNQKETKKPLAEFYLPTKFLIYNYSTNETTIIKYIEKKDKENIKKHKKELKKELEQIKSIDDSKIEQNPINFEKRPSNLEKQEYKKIVKKAKEYIKKGEAYQIVLSRKIRAKYDSNPFDLYTNLREINPSSYLYYLDFGERKLIGSSPEMLVRSRQNQVETVPIAGTIERGKNQTQDKKLANQLLKDPKENSEHVMLVDLARNDIGKVSKFGSVKVTQFKRVKKFSHVQHITSKVVGKLKQNKSMFDAFKACFPAGTVSGAPKIRAIQIINELEKDPRGPYSGAVGYFSFNQEMDFAITIRTFYLENNNLELQVGAGIVGESEPEKEWEETNDKAAAGMKALTAGDKNG